METTNPTERSLGEALLKRGFAVTQSFSRMIQKQDISEIKSAGNQVYILTDKKELTCLCMFNFCIAIIALVMKSPMLMSLALGLIVSSTYRNYVLKNSRQVYPPEYGVAVCAGAILMRVFTEKSRMFNSFFIGCVLNFLYRFADYVFRTQGK